MTDSKSQRLPSSVNVAIREAGRHRCRPVHPQCAALASRYETCTCLKQWGYVDGIDKSLAVYQRLDRQTKWGRHHGAKGSQIDADESLPSPSNDEPTALGLDAYESDLKLSNDIDGFWKESEFRAQFTELPTDIQKDDESA